VVQAGVGRRRRDDTAHRCPRAGRDAAHDRDQGIQVRTAHSQRPRGLDGDDEEPHTVTSATGAFSSAGLVNDDTFVQTFTKPGTYQYFCKIHPYMKGTLVVK